MSICDGTGSTCVAPLVNTVYFYRVIDGPLAPSFFSADDTWQLLSSVNGAAASITDLGAGALGRTYTWSFALTTAVAGTWYPGVALPGTPELLVVVGMTGASDALIASPNTNVTEVVGSS